MARKISGKPRDPNAVTSAVSEGMETSDAIGTRDVSASDTGSEQSYIDVDKSAKVTGQMDDAEVVSETPPPPHAQDIPKEGDTSASDLPPRDTDAAGQADTPPVDETPSVNDPAPRLDPVPPPAPKPSFVPMVLGGAFAAILGYGAHMVTQSTPVEMPDIAGLQTEIATLRAQVQGLDMPAPFDPTPLHDQIATLRATVAALEAAEPGVDPAMLDAVTAQAQSVADRAAALDGMVATLRDDMDALQDDMADLRDLSENRVAQAEAAVDTALARAGLDSVRAALDTGAAFTSAASQIEQAGIDVPTPISRVADSGIATPDELIERFDEAARAGLRASLTTAPAANVGERFGNFVRAQTGARSTAPREGDDPDAVLSRAGAAVALGDFDTALVELAALPETGRAAMADWIDAAQSRAAALAALPDLTQAIAP